VNALSLNPPDSLEAPTFLARGVAVPFTAPMLATTRIRPADRGTIEVVLPNPSGSPGVFITDWPHAAKIGNATMHDAMLFRGITQRGTPDPRTVRDAALAIAADRLAGPAAAASVQDRIDSDQADRIRVRDVLAKRVSGGQPLYGALEEVIAKALNIATAHAAIALRECCDAVAPIGLSADDQQSRLPRMIERLDRAGEELQDWAGSEEAYDGDGIGVAMATILRGTAQMGRGFVAGLRRWFADPVALLRRGLTDPASLRHRADRALWLLDGWERLGLIWQAADTVAQRRLAILEIAHGLPSIPAEAFTWKEPSVSPGARELTCKVSYGGQAKLSTAASMLLIRRNEAVRALSL
jgi:hypothetical protein